MHPASQLGWAVLDRTQTTPDWRIPERRLPEHLVYLAVDGEAAGEIEGAPVRLLPGAFLWIDPQVAHSFWNIAGKPPLDLFHLRFRLRHRGREVSEGRRPRLTDGAAGLRGLCQMLRTENWFPHADSGPHQKALLCALLIQAGRIAQDLPGVKLSEPQRLRIEAAALQARYQISPAFLAGLLRLNADYFRRLFTATYGMPPRLWIVRRRLESAQVLLRESTLNISEIAEQIGYTDVFQFSRRFKAEFGQSPTSYRRT